MTLTFKSTFIRYIGLTLVGPLHKDFQIHGFQLNKRYRMDSKRDEGQLLDGPYFHNDLSNNNPGPSYCRTLEDLTAYDNLRKNLLAYIYSSKASKLLGQGGGGEVILVELNSEFILKDELISAKGPEYNIKDAIENTYKDVNKMNLPEVILRKVKNEYVNSEYETDTNEYYKVIYSKRALYQPALGMVFPKKVAKKSRTDSQESEPSSTTKATDHHITRIVTSEFNHEAKMMILAGKRRVGFADNSFGARFKRNICQMCRKRKKSKIGNSNNYIGKKYVPNVIGLDEDGSLYMEFLDGYKDLFKVITQERDSLKANQIKNIIREIFIAMMRFHHILKFSHNDLKPEDIMIKFSEDSADISLLVIDWASATNKIMSKSSDDLTTRLDEDNTISMLLPDKFTLTYLYLPPELLEDYRMHVQIQNPKIPHQFDGKYLMSRGLLGLGNDSWALGATIYAILTSKNLVDDINATNLKEIVNERINYFFGGNKVNSSIFVPNQTDSEIKDRLILSFTAKNILVFGDILYALTESKRDQRFGSDLDQDKKTISDWINNYGDLRQMKLIFNDEFFLESEISSDLIL